MSDLVALIRQIVQAELRSQPGAHFGVVEKIQSHAEGDTENYGCDVRLRGRDLVLSGVPLATPHLGTVATPAAGDVVLILFADGRPVIAGRLYSDVLPAPPYAESEVTTIIPPGPDAANSDRVELKAKGGSSRSWSVALPDDTSLTITEKKIEAVTGDLKVTLDGKQVTVDTGGAKLIIKDGGDIEIQGSGNLKINADGNLEMKAGGNLSLEAGGEAKLKGAVVNIN